MLLSPYISILASLLHGLASILLTIAVCRALTQVRKRDLSTAQYTLAEGSITALTVFLAATLLKILAQLSWHQLGIAFCLASLRVLLKKAMLFQIRVREKTTG